MTAKIKSTSPLSLLVPLVLVIALVAGLVLMRQVQDTRRGAYFSSTKMFLQPETSQKKVGENLPIALFVDTPAKVDFVKAKICYTNIIGVDESQLDSLIEVNREAFDVALLTKVEDSQTSGQKCLTMSIKSEKASENLKSGVVRVATIKYSALAMGSGSLTIDASGSQVSGYNASGNDMSIKIDDVKGATFVIGEGLAQCAWCGTECVRRTSDMNCIDVAPPTGKKCTEVGGVCTITDETSSCSGTKPADVCTAERLKVRAECVNGIWDYDEQLCNQAGRTDVCGGTNYCCPTAGGSWTTDMTACGGTSVGGDSVLNYKVAFRGLQPDAKCAVGWPLKITVLANGVSKTYDSVPVKEGNYYKGSVVLTGFTAKNGVAVFVKSSKGLQMKYGKDGQVGFYGKPGGEIVLTDSASTSPWYDFTNYPIVPGDVVGINSDTQDGWINGVDFSYVKQRSLTHETVAEGAYLQADLDGNCQVNSNDVNVLKISLNEKQGELY